MASWCLRSTPYYPDVTVVIPQWADRVSLLFDCRTRLFHEHGSVVLLDRCDDQTNMMKYGKWKEKNVYLTSNVGERENDNKSQKFTDASRIRTCASKGEQISNLSP